MKKVGVLALQGDFASHEARVRELGAAPVQIREAKQFYDIDGLIMPGGESSAMLKLLRAEGLWEALAEFVKSKPVFGTCAGAILLAKDVANPEQEGLAALDIGVERNAYGRQRESEIVAIEPEKEFSERSGPGPVETVFIRAPVIRRMGSAVKVLMRYKGDPVLVEQGNIMAATFHPELTDDVRVHRLFLGKM